MEVRENGKLTKVYPLFIKIELMLQCIATVRALPLDNSSEENDAMWKKDAPPFQNFLFVMRRLREWQRGAARGDLGRAGKNDKKMKASVICNNAISRWQSLGDVRMKTSSADESGWHQNGEVERG